MADSGSAVTGARSAVCGRPLNGPNAAYFPNVVVVTHENRRALFYDDLLRGKVVIVSFMSINNDAICRSCENLAKVQKHLGDRLGRVVFMYSITVDPVHDSAQALAEFANRQGAQPGWLFLTGAPSALDSLRGRFFAGAWGHAGDCSMGMLRYGNEAVGLWGSVPVSSAPEAIAMRVSWVETRPRSIGPPVRKGPMPRGSTMQQGTQER